MKMKRKALILTLCAVLLVAASVTGTMAYLTSKDEVKNTFTVGKVNIILDESPVDADGKTKAGDRVKANDYKLLPGSTYDKDPMVTVKAGSEKAYVKMTVTVSKANELDAIPALAGTDLMNIFKGYDGTTWLYKGNTKDTTADTRTYEFWYKEPVTATTSDVELDALFDHIEVPGSITQEQLATIDGMTITVNAYAIQTVNFTDAADAWANFSL